PKVRITSEGMGGKTFSKAIIKKMPIYPYCSIISTIHSCTLIPPSHDSIDRVVPVVFRSNPFSHRAHHLLLQKSSHDFNEPFPVPDKVLQRFSPVRRDGVIFPPPSPAFFPPVGGNHPPLFQTLQGEIKGRLLQREDALGSSLDRFGYFIAVAVLFA